MSVNFDCESVADFLSSYDCALAGSFMSTCCVKDSHLSFFHSLAFSSHSIRQSFHPRSHTYPSPHWHLAIKSSLRKFQRSFGLLFFFSCCALNRTWSFCFFRLPASSQLCGAIDFNIIDFFVLLPTTRFVPYFPSFFLVLCTQKCFCIGMAKQKRERVRKWGVSERRS